MYLWKNNDNKNLENDLKICKLSKLNIIKKWNKIIKIKIYKYKLK